MVERSGSHEQEREFQVSKERKRKVQAYEEGVLDCSEMDADILRDAQKKRARDEKNRKIRVAHVLKAETKVAKFSLDKVAMRGMTVFIDGAVKNDNLLDHALVLLLRVVPDRMEAEQHRTLRHTHTHSHTHTFTHTHTYTHKHTRTHTHSHTHSHTQTQTQTHTHTNTHTTHTTHTHTRVTGSSCNAGAHARARVYVLVLVRAHVFALVLVLVLVCVCVRACVCVCMCVCAHAHKFTHVHAGKHMHSHTPAPTCPSFCRLAHLQQVACAPAFPE